MHRPRLSPRAACAHAKATPLDETRVCICLTRVCICSRAVLVCVCAQLCLYQLVLGYTLREQEAKGEADEAVGR